MVTLIIPEEALLNKLSYKASFDKSLKKISMQSISEEDKLKLKYDILNYGEFIVSSRDLDEWSYRIKSLDSFMFKLKRYRESDRSLFSVANDVLSIRIIVDSYDLVEETSYLRRVDMTQGKKNDDGYRGIHCYYSASNQHYPIELQIWSKHDAKFNIWTHIYSYKHEKPDTGIVLREAYDRGVIQTEKDFVKSLQLLKEDAKKNGIHLCSSESQRQKGK